jgi:hypothetical protein
MLQTEQRLTRTRPCIMNTYADKAAETKGTSIANSSPTRQGNGRASSQFSDKRPEAAALMKMQELADNSPRVSQLRSLQELANNSRQAKQATQFQALADPRAPLPIQHKIANGIAQRAQEATEDDELIQAKTQTAQRQPNEPGSEPRPNNTGLPDNLKAGIEALSDLSLDNAKVHYNSTQSAQLNALAYAQGSDIHLAPGQDRHLPREALHADQQKQGRVRSTLQLKGIEVSYDRNDPVPSFPIRFATRMRTHHRAQEQARRPTADAVTRRSGDDAAFAFSDHRPEALAQRKLHALADNSPRVRQLAAASGPGTIQREWNKKDDTYLWDTALDGVAWFADEEGLMWFVIADPEGVVEGMLVDYRRLEGIKKSWDEWNEISVKPHPRYRVEEEAEKEAEDIPGGARSVIRKFGEGGLLIKSVQMNNAHLDFQDADVSMGQALEAQKTRYGSKRNWSLAHGKLKPNYYKMGALMMPRNISLLADPAALGYERFLEMSESDMSSNSKIPEGKRPMDAAVAEEQLAVLKDRLIDKQAASDKALDNSEIQTVGFSSTAIIGFMFKEGGLLGSWDAARASFQLVVNKICSSSGDEAKPLLGFTPSTRSEFYVFTYREREDGTQLVYLDTLKPAR